MTRGRCPLLERYNRTLSADPSNVLYHIAAIKGPFQRQPPDVLEEETLPGRELAELVALGLQSQGFDGITLEDAAPIFLVTAHSGGLDYTLSCSLYLPDEVDPVWIVECDPHYSFWQRLVGYSEEEELGRLLDALAALLARDPRPREVRWFRYIPSNPFHTERFSPTPRRR